jgi:hypothetical protein
MGDCTMVEPKGSRYHKRGPYGRASPPIGAPGKILYKGREATQK